MKKTNSVAIIGGADGPISVFVAGNSKKKPLKACVGEKIYRCKRKIVASRIKAGTHSLEEVAEYIKEKYNAVEISRKSKAYIEQKRSLKESLIITNKPELLGDMKDIQRPKVFNEETIKELQRQIELRSEMIENIPDEEITMDFHIFKIRTEKGSMEIGIDYIWNIFECSYSGSKKAMKRLNEICKDVYIYYGVTKEDIKNNTKRYSALVTILST